MKTIELDDKVGIVNARLIKKSFATSTFEATLFRAAFDTPASFEWGEEITLTLHGATVMIGIVTRCKPIEDGNKYYWELVISDYWDRLATTPALNIFEGMVSSRFWCGIDMYQSPGKAIPLTVPVSQMIGATLAGAAHLLPNGYRVDISGPGLARDWMAVPFAASADMFGTLLQQALDWCPDLVSYFDYADGGVLVITDKADDRAVTLDPLVDQLGGTDLTPRHDLVPPVVAIIATGKSDGYGASVMLQYPEGVDVSQPYAEIATVDVPDTYDDGSGDDTSAVPEPDPVSDGWRYPQQMLVIGKKLPIDKADEMKKWWAAKFPGLQQAGTDFRVGKSQLLSSSPDLDIGMTPGYDPAASYELVQGIVNGKTKTLKWGEKIVESFLIIKNPPSNMRSYFPGKYAETGDVWRGVLRCRYRSVNKTRQTYRLDPESTELDENEEEDTTAVPTPAPELPTEDYKNLCESVYKSRRRLPYEGTVPVFSRIGLNALCGASLNIANDRPERADMFALVQCVDYDVVTEQTVITIGPPTHISLQDIMNRIARMQSQQDYSLDQTAANDTRGSNPSGGGWWDWDDKRVDAPGLGPWYALVPNVSTQPIEADFSVRVVYNLDGDVQSVECRQGVVIGPKGSMTVGEGEWTTVSGIVDSGDVYVNVDVDEQGNITSARLETYPGPQQPAEPFPKAKTGFTEWEFDVNEDFAGKSGFYSYHIATVNADRVTHHHLGAIVLPILPQQAIYEIRDFDWDPLIQGEPTDAPTHTPDDTSTPEPVSLIDKWNRKYALLRKVAPDPLQQSISVWAPDGGGFITLDLRVNIREQDGIIYFRVDEGTHVPTI